jgi:glucokinase
MPIFKGKVRVISSQLQNQSAPIIGASSLIIDKLKKDKEDVLVDK